MKPKGLLVAVLLLTGVICAYLLLTTHLRVSELREEREDLRSLVDETRQRLYGAEENLREIENRLALVREEVLLLRSAARYVLRDPTLLELAEFLARDRTDSLPYNKENFKCLDYAVTLNNNAENAGMRCAFVTVYLSGVNHAIVAFDTTDGGRRYFEPQTDEGVRLSVGRHYWGECVLNYSSLWYYVSGEDDVVEGWELYW
ncbi:MAG: hypothetical protein QW356_05905 [Candidatus Hadarchaeales archaeon]